MTTRHARILCVEDEPETIELIKLILGRHGYEVLGAKTGIEALETMRREHPDLILLDLMLPGMDGWEVHRQMKADPQLHDIPVIVVTAKAQGIDRVLGLHVVKVDDYITKPFHVQELVEAVKRVLDAKRQEEQEEQEEMEQASNRAQVVGRSLAFVAGLP